MKTLSIFHPIQRSAQTVKETIMKPITQAWRPGRWLMAAAMALGLNQTPASVGLALAAGETAKIATPAIPAAGKLAEALKQLKPAPHVDDRDGTDEPGGGDTGVIFHKTGAQIDCDYVVYKIRFGFKAPAGTFDNPLVVNQLKAVRFDFKDQIPAGLSVVSTTIIGDVTDAGGINPPASAVSTTTTTNDTLKLSDFRMSASDLNGDGSPTERYVDIKITAKIDRAAFPAVAFVFNQAELGISAPDLGNETLYSHDPAFPDDHDYTVAEKTKIKIDVTKCTPPGGGDKPEEACFKVDTGTVDCDKDGAGAFIYHMTVGAEMAGKVIELTTTNPGVTIAPVAQVVPAGGGVLDWTITGAMPGDVIHIVVVGAETFAGPKEGWGLCCTQTIDITIPKDIDCPKKHPDIKVEKRADVPYCDKLAGGCKFTIRVTNSGDVPYIGPIVLDEVTLPGNAAIDSGPNAPWVCAPLTSPMQCTYPAANLAPGAFVELKIGFKPGPAWNAHYIRNCAAYNYGASGKAPFGNLANDKACAEIPLCKPNSTLPQDKDCQPPVEKKADLQIRKIAREFCTADGLCLYGIQVTNVGPVTHNGPLTVVDQFPGGVPTSVTFAPTPPWVCATINPSQFQCDHPGLVLVPGASTVILVRAVVPLDYPDGKVENCATVKPVPTETNLANNKACATAKLRRPNNEKPTLRITKICRPGIAGGAVSCRITVINAGTVIPTGPVRVSDAATIIGSGAAATITSVTPDGAEWACTAVPAANLSCQIPGAVMLPGTSRHFDVTVQVNGGARFKNCARGSFGPVPGGDIVYPIGEACAEGGTDISVKKTGPAQCEIGQPCAFTVTITNNGASDFSGPAQIGDALEIDGVRMEGVVINSVEPPFGCSPEPSALPFGCTANVSIPAGASQAHVVTVTIPDTAAGISPNGANGLNCVGVTGDTVTIAPLGAAGGAAAGGEDGAYSCHPFRVFKAEEVKQCSDGFVLNANGRCVCPEGTRFSQGRGRCVGQPDPVKPVEPQQPDEPQVDQPKLCTLLPGMIRTQNGNCICPRGTELRNGACKRPVVEQCTLLPGQIRTKNGNCICPRGTELRNGACRKPVVEQCTLLPGQIRTKNGQCICPANTVLKNGRCETKVRQCTLLPGQIRTKNGQCICPRGTVLGRKGCVQVEVPQVQCRIPGQIKTKNGQCICPRGTALINGECAKRVDDTPTRKTCPRGTVGVFPLCVEPGQIQRRCPRGTVGEFPNCRKVGNTDPAPGIQLKNGNRLQLLDQQNPG